MKLQRPIDNNTDNKISSTLPFEELLNETEIEEIRNQSNVVNYLDNDIIFKQNTRTSHVMYIISGLIKLYRESRNNKTKIIKLGIPGEFIGLNSIFGEDTYSYSAAALEKTMIYIIDRHMFEQIIRHNGHYSHELLKTISSENLTIFKRLISQSQKQLPGRIADIILYFSETIYQSQDFTFPLTRTELAELAGTTKESLIRTLTEFKNDKIIKLEGKKVHIISYDIIKTLSRLG
jgi:CRP/FNR family transcriptional regulator, polysaccharide utilization system transcription regulator